MKHIQLSDTIIDTDEMQVTDIPIGENREETLAAGTPDFSTWRNRCPDRTVSTSASWRMPPF